MAPTPDATSLAEHLRDIYATSGHDWYAVAHAALASLQPNVENVTSYENTVVITYSNGDEIRIKH